MDYRISAVIALMEKKLHQKPSLREMARSVQLSPSRLRHIFKAETALTPKQYLKSLRMREAKKIMGAASFSVKEVMIRVGLSDKSHFERDFKKAFGLTPAQYKALCVRSHLVKNAAEDDKHISHQIAPSAIKFILPTIANHVTSFERRPVMEQETLSEVAEPRFDELFEELNVVELEDRLELSCRCCCRINERPSFD